MELVSNVWVQGRWYGPDYPDAGDPPQDSVTNPAAWGQQTPGDRAADVTIAPPEPEPAPAAAPAAAPEDSGESVPVRRPKRKDGVSV